MKNLIAIISGEPKSINSEIIVKSWKALDKNIKKKIFLIGNYNLFKEQLKKIKIKTNLKKIFSIDKISVNNSLKILDVPLKYKSAFKVDKKDNALYIKKCLNLAHKLSINKKIGGFINAPIDKKFLNLNYLGVTEYLAKQNNLKSTEVMLIYNKNLSVSPVTTHLPSFFK